MTLGPGTALGGGRYRLESLRGRGGMAAVWRALDTQLERPVAIKVIADSLAADPEFRRRFEREARAAAAVSHPHVVKLFDYGLEDDRPFLVMEYVDGPNLAELAKDGGAAAPDADRLASDLLEAVCHIHKAGVLHRDIKPANLLLTADGQLRVTDFGIARLDETTQITRAGMVVGTERYIAPEVAAGRPASPQSDLYSCGAVLQEVMAATGASPAVRALVAALREEDPARRPASAEAALELLREGGAGWTAGAPGATAGTGPDTVPLAADEPTAATAPLGRPDRGTRPTAVIAPAPAARRGAAVRDAGSALRRARAPLAALAALATVVVIAVLASGGGGAERPAVPPPAPETAPLGEQVDRLEQIVRRIGENQRP